MRASHAVSLANQILHDHFKLTNITIIRGENLKSISFLYRIYIFLKYILMRIIFLKYYSILNYLSYVFVYIYHIHW